jgi:hypothetical protein
VRGGRRADGSQIDRQVRLMRAMDAAEVMQAISAALMQATVGVPHLCTMPLVDA